MTAPMIVTKIVAVIVVDEAVATTAEIENGDRLGVHRTKAPVNNIVRATEEGVTMRIIIGRRTIETRTDHPPMILLHRIIAGAVVVGKNENPIASDIDPHDEALREVEAMTMTIAQVDIIIIDDDAVVAVAAIVRRRGPAVAAVNDDPVVAVDIAVVVPVDERVVVEQVLPATRIVLSLLDQVQRKVIPAAMVQSIAPPSRITMNTMTTAGV